ncbi:hypothetical protein SBOR_7251 [Sclerotinia borealis F-4128]|uniref:Hsp70 family protein n=1 Tax=Sclerotinia borealis (strain F-4128) TaxID=1432307 RepID=W9C6I5_SCLBF|nr:hypothetical protein SBOR_7251 [Sclerotinia borealis F-4128]
MSTPLDLRSLRNTLDSVYTKGNGHKIIIGIDYGTTFSGVSYVTSDKTGLEDITIMSPWPGDPHVSWKTPTRIAYSRENPTLKNNKWGFEVNPKLKSYSWTKLLLDNNAAAMEHDDPSLVDMTGSGMLQVPPFRDAAGVCEDFLHEVYTHVSGKLRQQMTDLTFENTPMQCWVTLPAVWSEEAKDATLKAAKNAGFGKRPGDEIYTIAEPEAAAIATLKEYAKSDAMNPILCNENILICDCGGGTIDITTYTIIQVQPYLTFDELCVGIGGKCGSTYIDRNLHSLLSERFGSAFDELQFSQKGPGSRFMASFEMLKRDFGRNDEREVGELGPLNLDILDSESYDREDRLVLLTYKDMLALFDPVVREITNLVKQQVKAAKDSQNAKINVGSHSHNEQKQRSPAEIRDASADHFSRGQSAVVRGAALRGLMDIAPRGDDITKGTSRITDVCCEYTPGTDTVLYNALYACVAEQPPEYYSTPRVELVGTTELTLGRNFDFGKYAKKKYNAKLNRWVHRLESEEQIIFGSTGDNLTFRSLIGGKEIGNLVMKFDH